MKRRCVSFALFGIATFVQCAGYAQPAEQAPDTMAARVMACAPCHGAEGEGTDNAYFPRLAGKPAGYLSNQLHAFHTGRRHYPPMNYLLAYLPDDYLKQIAEYFGAAASAAGAGGPYGQQGVTRAGRVPRYAW